MEELNQTPEVVSDQQPVVNNNSFLVSLLSTLLLLAVLIAGFFAYQTQNLVKELRVMSDQSKPTPTSIPSPDSTADWKKYVDPSGFSFSYPNNLEIEESGNKIIVRIDFPRIETKVGVCPRYVSFSIADNNSFSKTTEDKYSCIYKSTIKNQKVFTESQYSRGLHNLNDQILSTLKFIEPIASTSPVACTMEAKICPDGSAVGRSGPRCEFAPCPTPRN